MIFIITIYFGFQFGMSSSTPATPTTCSHAPKMVLSGTGMQLELK